MLGQSLSMKKKMRVPSLGLDPRGMFGRIYVGDH